MFNSKIQSSLWLGISFTLLTSLTACGGESTTSPTSSSSEDETSSSSLSSSSSSWGSFGPAIPIASDLEVIDAALHYYEEVINLADSGVVYKVLANAYDSSHSYQLLFTGKEESETFTLLVDSVMAKTYYDGSTPYIEAWYYFDNAEEMIPTGDLYSVELVDIDASLKVDVLDTAGFELLAIHSGAEGYFGLISLLNPSRQPTDTLKSSGKHYLEVFPHVDQYQGTLYITDDEDVLIGTINSTGGLSVVNKEGEDEYYQITLESLPDSILVEGEYFAKFKTRDTDRWSSSMPLFLMP